MNKKIYIAGPMSGYESYNFEAFFYRAALIRQQGDTPINPAQHDVDKMLKGWVYKPEDYDEVIAYDLDLIQREADALYMLRGWNFSNGARLEHKKALELGIPIEYEAKKHIYIVGHGRHGKDTLADILSIDYGCKHVSSSWFMAENVVFPALKEQYGYETVEQCFEDRINHRAEWFDLIDKANATGTELSEAIFKDNDIYVGIRNKRELDAVKADSRFDPFVIWVDASERLGLEPSDSMQITIKDADYVVKNNGTYFKLVSEMNSIMEDIYNLLEANVK